jgi:hypothetical protein
MMISGFVLVGVSVWIIYIGRLSFGSLSLAVTLLWIASFLILIARATRKV